MESTIEQIAGDIEKLKSIIANLRRMSQGIPALDRNLARIAASVKMLELNFVDPGIESGNRSMPTMKP